MIKTLRPLTAITAIAAGLVAISAPAAAKEARVSYSDLDLSTATGRAELDKRVDRAAAQVCEAKAITGSRIRKSSLARKCIADARKQIGTHVARLTTEAGLGG